MSIPNNFKFGSKILSKFAFRDENFIGFAASPLSSGNKLKFLKNPPLDKEGARGRYCKYYSVFNPLLKFLLKVERADFNVVQVNPS